MSEEKTEQTLKIDPKKLSVLLSIEKEAFEQEDRQSLLYVIANATYRIVSYQRLIFFDGSGERNSLRLVGASSQTSIDKQSPFANWAERLLQKIIKEKQNIDKQIWRIEKSAMTKHDQEAWQEWLAHSLSIIPIVLHKKILGYIWLERDKGLDEEENKFLNHLVSVYGLCLSNFEKDTKKESLFHKVKKFFAQGKKRWIALFVLLLILFPVRHSILVQAEVVPKDPAILTAPLSGTIKDILIEPYATVEPGDQLVIMDQEDWQSEAKVIQEQLQVAKARWQTALRNAFQDQQSKRDIKQLAAEVEAKQADFEALTSILRRGDLVSPVPGVAVFSNKSDLIGKPVQAGEKIMMIAQPSQVELQFFIPTASLIDVRPDVSLSFLPDIKPLSSIKATLKFIAYEASKNPSGDIVYQGYASFAADNLEGIPIGAKGMARLYGDYTVLGYKWFNKPIRLIRRYVGF